MTFRNFFLINMVCFLFLEQNMKKTIFKMIKKRLKSDDSSDSLYKVEVFRGNENFYSVK